MTGSFATFAPLLAWRQTFHRPRDDPICSLPENQKKSPRQQECPCSMAEKPEANHACHRRFWRVVLVRARSEMKISTDRCRFGMMFSGKAFLSNRTGSAWEYRPFRSPNSTDGCRHTAIAKKGRGPVLRLPRPSARMPALNGSITAVQFDHMRARIRPDVYDLSPSPQAALRHGATSTGNNNL